MFRLELSVPIAILLLGSGEPGPFSPDEAVIISAVIADQRAQLQGRIGFEPRRISSGANEHPHLHWDEEHSADLIREVTSDPTVVLAKRSDVRRCVGQGPRSCRLVGVNALLAFSRPAITGNSATVRMIVEANVTRGMGTLGMMDALFTLVRDEGSWRVVRRDVLAVS